MASPQTIGLLMLDTLIEGEITSLVEEGRLIEAFRLAEEAGYPAAFVDEVVSLYTFGDSLPVVEFF